MKRSNKRCIYLSIGLFLLLLTVQGQNNINSIDTLILDSSYIVINRYILMEGKAEYSEVNEYYLSDEIKNKYFSQNRLVKYGIYFAYYKSGNVKEVSNYFNDRKIDDEYNYYENGQMLSWGKYISLLADTSIVLKCDTIYKVDEIFGEKIALVTCNTISKKVGKWQYWNEKGKLIKEEYYKDGELIQVKNY